MMDESQTPGQLQRLDKDTDAPLGDNPLGEDVETEEIMGIPFGVTGATILTNVLQYSLLVGLSMVILIIMRIFMPASMLAP